MDRPSVWQASLSVKRSTVPGAGLGVFLTRDSSPVKAGTVLTVYGDSFAEVDHLGTDKTKILPVRPCIDLPLLGAVPWLWRRCRLVSAHPCTWPLGPPP